MPDRVAGQCLPRPTRGNSSGAWPARLLGHPYSRLQDASDALAPRVQARPIVVLSKLMTLSEEHGLRPFQSNPARQMKRYRENMRQRFLFKTEYERLGHALAAAEPINE